MRDFSLTLVLSRWERRPEAFRTSREAEYLFDRFVEMEIGANKGA